MEVKKISRTKQEINGKEFGSGLKLTFKMPDSSLIELEIDSETLRKECPCASCQQKRGDDSHSRPLSGKKKSKLLNVVSATKEEECNIEKIWLLGNYAIGMKWSDGHDTGIYTFNFLFELAKQKENIMNS